MKDPNEFTKSLDLPLDGVGVGEADLDEDANAFMAFASALGVKPPADGDLPSAASA